MKKKILLIPLTVAAFLVEGAGQIPLAEEKVIVTNERRINSEELEFSPVFYKEGIVFISTRRESVAQNIKDTNIGGKNIMSIYQSQRDEEGFLLPPQPLAIELISRLHEGPVTFDRTAEYIFYTRNEGVEQAPDGYKKLQIYGAQNIGGIWQNMQKLSFNNVNYNYAHPSISPDGDVMYIASDVPGGYGGMDLYAVYQVGGKWEQMINLGEEVNTAGNDVFPFIAADGTLYFSSDGHGGLGNLDIFYSRKVGNKWMMPVNLNVPFNSTADDLGFIVDRDNKNGYFSSDRKGGFGDDDIYSFYIHGDITPAMAGVVRSLDGLVVLDENGNPVEGADVSAINFDEVSVSAGDERVVKLIPGDGRDNFILDVNSEGMGNVEKTDMQGKAGMELAPGSYVLKINKEGYLPEYVTVGPETDLSSLNVTLRKAVDCIALTGKVMMGEANLPVSGASVQIVDVDTKESVTVYTDDQGMYEYCIKCNRNYTVYAVKNNAASAPGVASAKGIRCDASAAGIDLPLYIYGAPLYAGMSIVLPNIYFNFDDAALRPDAYKDLDEVVGMLQNYPDMKLELASHTDARGTHAYNLDLSKRRSESVYKYLVSRGVDAERLSTRGYGESQIRNRCVDGVACVEQEHQYNRRTEVKITEMGAPVEASVAPPAVAGTTPIAEDGLADVNNSDPESGEPNDEKGGGQDGVISPPFVTNETSLTNEDEVEGSFAVVAGTFANHDYAIRRYNLLTKMGYKETNIVKQERNGLYAIWVKTFDDKDEAQGLMRQLAHSQLSAYVLRR